MSALFGSKGSILDTVVRFFDEDNWHYQRVEGKPILRLGFKGSKGSWQCFAQANEEQERLMFYSILDSNVPEDKRQQAAEFLTRANYGLLIGNFEMDFSDGEVRYKTSIDVEGGQLTPTMVKNLVYANVMTMDKYFAGLMSVVYAGASPESAIAEIEGN